MTERFFPLAFEIISGDWNFGLTIPCTILSLMRRACRGLVNKPQKARLKVVHFKELHERDYSIKIKDLSMLRLN